MGSYSHLNIRLLRRKLSKTNKAIDRIDEIINSHIKEIYKHEKLLYKYRQSFFSNKGSKNICIKIINVYKSAVKGLENDKRELEQKRAEILAELGRKKKISSNIKIGVCAISLAVVGFVLISGDGAIQRQETISAAAEKDDDGNIDSREQIIYYESSSTQKQMNDSDEKSIFEIPLGEIFENVGEGIENFFEPYIESQRELQEELSKSTK